MLTKLKPQLMLDQNIWERLKLEIFSNSLIIRPGVVFGKGDNFTNFFLFLQSLVRASYYWNT